MTEGSFITVGGMFDTPGESGQTARIALSQF
jgi:hypothetical protein